MGSAEKAVGLSLGVDEPPEAGLAEPGWGSERVSWETGRSMDELDRKFRLVSPAPSSWDTPQSPTGPPPPRRPG